MEKNLDGEARVSPIYDLFRTFPTSSRLESELRVIDYLSLRRVCRGFRLIVDVESGFRAMKRIKERFIRVHGWTKHHAKSFLAKISETRTLLVGSFILQELLSPIRGPPLVWKGSDIDLLAFSTAKKCGQRPYYITRDGHAKHYPAIGGEYHEYRDDHESSDRLSRVRERSFSSHCAYCVPSLGRATNVAYCRHCGLHYAHGCDIEEWLCKKSENQTHPNVVHPESKRQPGYATKAEEMLGKERDMAMGRDYWCDTYANLPRIRTCRYFDVEGRFFEDPKEGPVEPKEDSIINTLVVDLSEEEPTLLEHVDRFDFAFCRVACDGKRLHVFDPPSVLEMRDVLEDGTRIKWSVEEQFNRRLSKYRKRGFSLEETRLKDGRVPGVLQWGDEDRPRAAKRKKTAL